MLAKHKVHSAQATGDTSRGSTYRHFRRLLSYAWPHKRYLSPAMGFVVLMAATYWASIGSILPVLTVMIQKEGLHGYVNRWVAKDRVGCEFTQTPPDLHEGETAPPPRITGLAETSVLHEAGLRRQSVVQQIDGEPLDPFRFAQVLAGPETEVALTFAPEAASPSQEVTITLPPLDVKQTVVYRIMRWLPGGTTPQAKWQCLIAMLLILVCVVLVGNIARVFAQYLTVLVNGRILIDIRREMYAHALRLPLSRYSKDLGDTMGMFVQDMNDIFRGLNNFFQKLVMEPFKAIGAITLALMLDWKLSLVVMLGSPLIVVMFRKFGKIIRRANKRLLINYGKMLGRLESTFTGMRVVKGYTRENHERLKMFRLDRSILRQQLHMSFIEALTSPLMEMIGFLAVAGAILYFGSEVLFEGVKPAKLMAMLGALVAIFDPLRKMTTAYPKLQRANAAAGRVFELIDSPSEYELDTGNTDTPTFTDTIEFDHVTFTYPDTDKPAVRDLSLTVRKGEVIAIVGPNGSGKTTLLALLPRFFRMDSGDIRIDGRSVNDITLTSLRRQFSLIAQESVIFPETVRENIAYGRPGATNEEIEAVAKLAFADDFIREMPEGYDTMVGPHGATLSGGQRQRLAIARAILRNAPILIFDEATGQVDPESEAKIHQALESFLADRTAFMIAHRYSTISDADRLVVMDEGRLVDVGTHEELFARCPLYRRLYETQFNGNG